MLFDFDPTSGSMPSGPPDPRMLEAVDAVVRQLADGTELVIPFPSTRDVPVFPPLAFVDESGDLDAPFVIRITDGE